MIFNTICLLSIQQKSFIYVKAINFGMVEETGVTRIVVHVVIYIHFFRFHLVKDQIQIDL